MIYEAVPVKKPRTCVLPVACPAQPLPKFGILQVLCQSAHGQRVVSLVVFEVVCLPPAIAVAAFLNGIPDRSLRVVHSFFLSGTQKHSIGGRSTGRSLLPDLVGRLNERKPVLRSTSGPVRSTNSRRGAYTLSVGGYPRRASWRATADFAMAEDTKPVTYWAYEKISPSELQNARIAEDDWQIVAEYLQERSRTHCIEGLKSKEEVSMSVAG